MYSVGDYIVPKFIHPPQPQCFKILQVMDSGSYLVEGSAKEQFYINHREAHGLFIVIAEPNDLLKTLL